VSVRKALFSGEWIKTVPFVSTRLELATFDECEMCKGKTVAPHWYSIKRKAYRCTHCFTPEELA